MMTPSYARCGERLAASCREHGLDLALFEVPTVHRSISPKGSDDLCYTKANFVQLLIERYDRPVLYLDVDCVIVERPDRIDRLLADHVDFAIYNWLAEEHTEAYVRAEIEPYGRYYRFSHSIDERSDSQLMCSGAVQWYRNSAAARRLLGAWQSVLERAPGRADDECLDLAFNNQPPQSPPLRAVWLEKRYARYAWWIYERPVIDHPEFPGSGQGFVPLRELDGQPRIHAAALWRPQVAYWFPKDCLIDTQTRTLLRLHEGTWRPVGSWSTPLWLGPRGPDGVAADAAIEDSFREALALHREARLDDAAAAYRRVLERQPRHVHALNFLATIAYQADDFEQAQELASRALEVDPKYVGAHFIRGKALERLGRHAQAVLSYDEVIALDATLAEAHNNRGNALRCLNRHEAALLSYERVIALLPDLPEPHFNRGLALHGLNRYDAALASFDRALDLEPRYAEAHYARGNVLKDLRRLGAALASYDQAIAARAEYAAAFVNRGNVLAELERFAAALASYDRAIALDPDHADAHCNRGSLLSDLGRHEEALASLDRALAIDPEHALAHFMRAFVCLVRGDLLTGFREFEWRWRCAQCVTSREKRDFAQPQWSGAESLDGKTILVHCEQGLGDTIQFCRYVQPLAAKGARVVFEVPPALRGLLASLDGVSHWVLRGEPLPPFDTHCPMLSLPLAFATTLATVPCATPYLRASRERLHYWQHKLGARTRPRVGLVWSGGSRPDQPELWAVNRRRNIPLALLAALKHPGIEFHSLQKGQPAEGELDELLANGWDGPALVNHTAELSDFAETAALIEQLDLVISVDTSTAHLAGALGKPVWLLNRFDGCWRWLCDRSDSPWYPSLKVYRQTQRGDWDGVIRRVRVDLENFVRRDGEPRR
jgi:tetratricopeptide (TPR) repeat protein